MTSSTITTKAEAEARLVEIAFIFQNLLLSYVHDCEPHGNLCLSTTKAKAEKLADEIQRLHHFFEPPQGDP